MVLEAKINYNNFNIKLSINFKSKVILLLERGFS